MNTTKFSDKVWYNNRFYGILSMYLRLDGHIYFLHLIGEGFDNQYKLCLDYKEDEDVDKVLHIVKYVEKKDRNDIPLYEGDIVKCMMATNSQICEGVIEWSNYYSAFTIRATTGKDAIDCIYECKEIERIGSIYGKYEY